MSRQTQAKNKLIKVLILISAASLLASIFLGISRAECCADTHDKQDLFGMTGWIPNIIPGNVVVFYDTDGDGEPDQAQAFHIIDGSAVRDCNKKMAVPEDMFLFTTCPSEHAFNYWTLRGGWECRTCMEGNFLPAWVYSGHGSGLQ